MRRFIQIDKKILDKEKKKTNFIIVHSEEDFNLKCKDKNQKESIHLLELSGDNQNLIWHKSRGPISDLKDFKFVKSHLCTYSNVFIWLKEDNFVQGSLL